MIRKHFPTMLAEQIVGVQPMTASTANIFNLKTKYAAESWKKKIIWMPKKSIYGKTVFGLVNERGVWKECKATGTDDNYAFIIIRQANYNNRG